MDGSSSDSASEADVLEGIDHEPLSPEQEEQQERLWSQPSAYRPDIPQNIFAPFDNRMQVDLADLLFNGPMPYTQREGERIIMFLRKIDKDPLCTYNGLKGNVVTLQPHIEYTHAMTYRIYVDNR